MKNKICTCGHPENEHLEPVGCKHYSDPTLKRIKKHGKNAHGTYCICERYEAIK